MNFTHFDLGNLDKGRIVEIHLKGNAANVYLIDNQNFQAYVQGQGFQAVGGMSRATPIRLQTNATTHWHIIVDLPGGYGTVRTSYRVLNKPSGNTVIAADGMMHAFDPPEAQKATASQTLSLTPPEIENSIEIRPSRQMMMRMAGITEEPDAPLNTVICEACQAEIERGKFCHHCGTPQVVPDKSCPSCGTPGIKGGRFCAECGDKLV